MDSMFLGYAYLESEGLIDTDLGKLNRFVKELAATDDPNDEATQYEVAYRVGLDPDSLSQSDLDYITAELNRYC